jgi:hypothetical protein
MVTIETAHGTLRVRFGNPDMTLLAVYTDAVKLHGNVYPNVRLDLRKEASGWVVVHDSIYSERKGLSVAARQLIRNHIGGAVIEWIADDAAPGRLAAEAEWLEQAIRQERATMARLRDEQDACRRRWMELTARYAERMGRGAPEC